MLATNIRIICCKSGCVTQRSNFLVIYQRWRIAGTIWIEACCLLPGLSFDMRLLVDNIIVYHVVVVLRFFFNVHFLKNLSFLYISNLMAKLLIVAWVCACTVIIGVLPIVFQICSTSTSFIIRCFIKELRVIIMAIWVLAIAAIIVACMYRIRRTPHIISFRKINISCRISDTWACLSQIWRSNTRLLYPICIFFFGLTFFDVHIFLLNITYWLFLSASISVLRSKSVSTHICRRLQRALAAIGGWEAPLAIILALMSFLLLLRQLILALLTVDKLRDRLAATLLKLQAGDLLWVGLHFPHLFRIFMRCAGLRYLLLLVLEHALSAISSHLELLLMNFWQYLCLTGVYHCLCWCFILHTTI